MRQTNALRHIRPIFAVSVLVAFGTHALGEDRLFFSPRYAQERDSSGKTAVLCALGQYLQIQALTISFKFKRRPVDDAIDKAIDDIDAFIMANSSTRPTQDALADLQGSWSDQFISKSMGACSGKYAEILAESRMVTRFRDSSPDRIAASVKNLLSIPREPVWNPCNDIAP